MISPRYATALCVVLALPLVPTLIHSYAETVVVDGRTTNSISQTLEGYSSIPSTRAADWGKELFSSDDWLERRYVSGNDEVLLTAIRSYDLKSLYHHPELAVAYSVPFMRHEVKRFPAHPNIPVHVLHTTVEDGSTAVYVLHYDGEFIENPLVFQIRTAGALLFSGRKPMTLIFARDLSAPRGSDVATLPVTRLLFEAVEDFARP
jgi:hypothetical protein